MTATRQVNENPQKILEMEVRKVGFTAKDALAALPDWWQDGIAEPSGLIEIRGFIAKHFGLEIGPDGKLRQKVLPNALFKTAKGTDIHTLAPARSMVAAVARIIATATKTEWKGTFPSASELRAEILAAGEKPWVGFKDLVWACWERGVPVVNIPNLPTSKKSMDGLVTFSKDRPVIVLSKAQDQPAWVLFVLGHEMGHIGCSHLPLIEGEAIIDEKIAEDFHQDDAQEAEANAYAIEVITGGADRRFGLPHLMNGNKFAAVAVANAERLGVDPGHLILNIASSSKTKNLWPLANTAVSRLESKGDASVITREAMRAHIDLDVLSDDSFEFLEKLNLI